MASNASVDFAPVIESKPMENKLLELMTNSKKIWNNFQENKKLSKLIELKNNSSLLVSLIRTIMIKFFLKKNFLTSLILKPRSFLQEKR